MDWTTEGEGEAALELEEVGEGLEEGREEGVSCSSATVTMLAVDVDDSGIGEVVDIVDVVGRRGMDDVGVGIVAASIALVDAALSDDALSAAGTPLEYRFDGAYWL